MNFKRWNLVYIAASVRILVATQNILNPHEENNIERDEAEQYIWPNFITPKYPRLQAYEIYRYDTYNNPMIVGGLNPEMPTGKGPEGRIGRERIKNPFIEEWVAEIKQTEQNLTSRNQLAADEYSRKIENLIKEQETAELDASVEQLITEINQTEQNSGPSMKLSEDEYNKLIEGLISGQESTDENTLVNNSGEMPIQEQTKEHRPYNMVEHAYSLTILESTEDSPYEYSNSTFLFNFLHFPSSFITADSIRVRFGPRFLSFLSPRQVIRVLIVLLENKLELSNEDQKEFIEIMFGHIDYSPMLEIAKDLVAMLVGAMMRSSVPEYFEYVFLTWKMWYSFTKDEQEAMLKDAKKEYKREILVMLYLFVVNRDEDNSQQCEIFKNEIKSQYKKTGIFNKGHYLLKNVYIEGTTSKAWIPYKTLDTFDMCLLDLPEVFKDLNRYDVTNVCNLFKNSFFAQYRGAKLKILRYKSHVCYVLTKFIREFEYKNNLGESNNIGTISRLCLDPEYIKFEFANWITYINKGNNLCCTVSADKREKEFVNAFAIIRQIMQCDGYNSVMFFKIFNGVSFTKIFDRPYLILLFILTNENILKNLCETQEWINYMQKRHKKPHNFKFIEDIFINNVNSGHGLCPRYNSEFYIKKIYETFSELNTKGNITMHREHHFYKHLVFHPQFRIFRDESILGYITGLSEIGQFNNSKQCDQIVRDLVFSEYYHKAAMELEDLVKNFEKESRLNKFKKSMKKERELYKNEGDIEKEREKFRRC